MASALVVNVLDLLRRPGAKKSVTVVAKADVFDFADSRINVGADVEIDIELESSVSGLVASGGAQVAWASMCRRCLRPVRKRHPGKGRHWWGQCLAKRCQ